MPCAVWASNGDAHVGAWRVFCVLGISECWREGKRERWREKLEGGKKRNRERKREGGKLGRREEGRKGKKNNARNLGTTPPGDVLSEAKGDIFAAI